MPVVIAITLRKEPAIYREIFFFFLYPFLSFLAKLVVTGDLFSAKENH